MISQRIARGAPCFEDLNIVRPVLQLYCVDKAIGRRHVLIFQRANDRFEPPRAASGQVADRHAQADRQT